MSQVRRIEGTTNARHLRFGIVASRYNEDVVERLIAGALRALREHDVRRVDVVRVPGAFEIPLAARRLVAQESKLCDALVAVGCVIRGQTPHFDHVVGECARGIARLTSRTGVPIGFGVLAVDNKSVALARCRNNARNRGYEAASAALVMANLVRGLDKMCAYAQAGKPCPADVEQWLDVTWDE